jgi:hypothetical protein
MDELLSTTNCALRSPIACFISVNVIKVVIIFLSIRVYIELALPKQIGICPWLRHRIITIQRKAIFTRHKTSITSNKTTTTFFKGTRLLFACSSDKAEDHPDQVIAASIEILDSPLRDIVYNHHDHHHNQRWHSRGRAQSSVDSWLPWWEGCSGLEGVQESGLGVPAA